MRYRLYHDPSTINATTIFTDTLDDYSQDAAISINSEENDIQFKAGSTTRLQIHNTSANAPGRIDFNIGDLTGANHTTHGELRFCRGDDPAIRYHSILTKHSHNNYPRSALQFLLHDPAITTDPANTGQRKVMALQGDGKVGINLDGTPAEILDVNGNVKCTDLKFEAVDGVTTSLSSVIDALLLRVAELESGIGIDITTGANDTFEFKHYITSSSSAAVITYTIVLAGQRYTTDEMLTAINAAIATQGSVQNAITTTMAFSGGRFIIRCTADTSVLFDIQIVAGSISNNNNNAAQSLGFVQNRIQEGTGGDLDLVATNTAPIDWRKGGVVSVP